MPDYASMNDAELQVEVDKAMVTTPTPANAEKLQIEWAKRNDAKFIREDGSVAYEPPDWTGG